LRRREAAFTLVELMIALAIVMLVLYTAINFFIVSVRQYKVQTKITETNVEGILGLELFRQDLESLGFGLPWNNLGNYTEKTGNGSALNDGNGIAPRAVLSINGGGGFTVNNSDYFVIKSARVGMNDAAGKWTTLTQADNKRTWTPDTENLDNNAYVIVLAVGSTDANRRSLVNPGPFYTKYIDTSAFVPVEPYSANIVYGIDNVQPVRPFNRAEYYIHNTDVPQRCAPNTGILVKEVVTHDGTTPPLLPLLDCVADMQVVYVLDTDTIPSTLPIPSDDIAVGMTAEDIRAQLVEVRVYILGQEGQRDDSYTYKNVLDNTHANEILVGPDAVNGRYINLSGYLNYRWKVYNIVVKPKNLAH
jgi:type II secretory pathway pseudopilin PulG